MTDLTEETIRTAFADLRAAEQPGFVPPGVAAAHRSVRRRRLVSATAAAGITAVMLGVGYLAAAGIGPSAPDSGTELGAQPAASQTATPSRDDLIRELAEQMYRDFYDPGLAELVYETVGGDALEDGVPIIPGADTTLGDFGAGEGVDGGDVMASGARALHPGTSYRLRVGCGGTGTVTFIFRVGDRLPGGPILPTEAGGRQYRLTAHCAETADGISAGVAETTVMVTSSGQWLTGWAEPDQAALADGRRPIVATATIPDW